MTTIYMDSVALGSELQALLPSILRRDQDLGRRMRRSYEDLEQHVGESMCVTGRARRFELEAAESAARELLACLKAAAGVGHLKHDERLLEQRIEQLAQRLSLQPKRAQAV